MSSSVDENDSSKKEGTVERMVGEENVVTVGKYTPPRASCVIELTNHDFQAHTYGTPTHCDICNALLTGLWSQGLKCQACGLNVHCKGAEYNCCNEALLRQCKSKDSKVSAEEQERISYEQTVAAINEEIAQDLAREEAEKQAQAKAANDDEEAPTANNSEADNDEHSLRKKHPTDSSFLPTISRLLPKDYAEQAHEFEVITFSKPTYCGVCSGILAGMWSQGKQCKVCGLVVHHGQGAGNHDNCHAEAMVKPCPMEQVEARTPPEEATTSATGTEAQSTETCAIGEYKSLSKDDEEEESGQYVSAVSSFLPGISKLSSPAKAVLPCSADSCSMEPPKDEHEKPHKFVEHSYGSPTYCNVCNGLLVGLWSQGFQCETCGLNVHRGEGINEHDDCKGEALLSTCSGKKIGEEQAMTLREAIKKSPHFFQDIKEQMNKDLMTHAKEAVVEAGVEGERSKNLRRFKEWLVPMVESLDAIEERGEMYSIFVLFRLHVIIALIVSVAGLLLFIIALCPKLGFGFVEASVFRLAVMHELTVLGTIHICLVVFVLVVQHYSIVFKQRSIIMEQYLVEMLGIHAEEDIGISVVGAAIRARAWSQRIAITATITCVIVVLLWQVEQPTLDELRRALSEDFLRAQNLLSEVQVQCEDVSEEL